MATKNPRIEEIKAAQEKVSAAENHHNSLAAKLAEIEDEKSAAHIAEREIPELIKQKGDIQAEMAMGNNSRKDELDKIVNKITQAQQDVECHAQTVAGLSRSLAAAKSDLEPLKHNTALLVSAFIREEADRIQAEYLELAKALTSKFRQLKALGTIARQRKACPDIFSDGMEHKHLSIPVFQLASCGQWPINQGITWPKWEPAREIAEGNQNYQFDDEETEKARLTSLGVVL